MSVEELLVEVAVLEGKRGTHGRLPLNEWARLRELNALLAERLGGQALDAERRHDLRLPVSATVRVGFEGIPAEAPCCEFSKGGLFIDVSPPLRTGALLQIDALILEEEHIPLEVRGVVVWRQDRPRNDGDAHGLPVGVGVKFVDPNEVAEQRIEETFERLLDATIARRAWRPHEDGIQQDGLLFRDDLQLLAACKALLRRVARDDLWTAEGPSEQAKAYLRDNARGLAADERALLLLVWSLWIGSCELRSTLLWHMDGETQESVMSLWVAARQEPDAVDVWLDAEAAPL